MKLNGFVGKGTGKLGSSVFAISGGEQIVRQYNPQVSNPSTSAQVAQRAKFKLLSQLAVALASVLAFTKQGLVSARNQFVSKNIGLAQVQREEQNDTASVLMADLQLTPGISNLPNVGVTAGQGGALSAELAAAAPSDVKAVVYVTCGVDDSAKLFVDSVKTITNAGASRTFPTELNSTLAQYVVYAYGIKDVAGRNGVTYEDYLALTDDTHSTLDAFRKIASVPGAFTKTVGIVSE